MGLRHLADFGAEVLKVEIPETGDMVRLWDDAVFGEGAVHFWVNPNKKSVTLNLKDERGKKILGEMIEGADVFLENFSPGAVDRLGFSYEEVKKIKPDIIYIHTSGYGQDGPYRDMKAFDGLIQAEAGIMEMTGPPESPAKMAHSICDGVTGLFVALGAMMALRQRDRAGEGQELDVSMFDCMVSMQGYFHFHYYLHGEKPSRVGVGHHFLAPYGAYPAKGESSSASRAETRTPGGCSPMSSDTPNGWTTRDLRPTPTGTRARTRCLRRCCRFSPRKSARNGGGFSWKRAFPAGR